MVDLGESSPLGLKNMPKFAIPEKFFVILDWTTVYLPCHPLEEC